MSTFNEEQMNGLIDRGLRLQDITRQLDDIKAQGKSDEIRALAAIISVLVAEIKTMVLFSSRRG